MTPEAQLSCARVDGFLAGVPNIVDRLFLRPLTTAVNYAAKLLARIHKPGVVNAYAAWVFLMLLVLLVVNRLL